MCISKQTKLIFVHNQKTAGTSVRWYLKAHVVDLRQILAEHAYASDAIGKMGRERWNRFYSFGFVRNPWSRMVSWYSMIRERPKLENKFWRFARKNSTDFESFLLNCTEPVREVRRGFTYERSLLQNQLDYFTDKEGAVAVNFIGKYECIDRDFAVVLNALGLPAGQLPRTNMTKEKDYRTFYNDHSREIVAERFQKDIRHFGYTFEDGIPGSAAIPPGAGNLQKEEPGPGS